MPTKGLSLLVYFFLQFGPLLAQEFCVEGVFSSSRSGSARLTLYEGSGVQRVMQSRVRGGRCVFKGSVSRPVVAELWHRSMSHPLVFYVENSRIHITIDDRNPSRSPVSGSRSNSEYRLLAEQWAEQPDYTSPYAPLVLLQCTDAMALLSDFDRLQGDALQVPHYALLQQRVERIKAVQPGASLPRFEFSDTAHRRVASDTLLCDTCYNVLLFGASYCGQCESAMNELQQLEAGPVPFHWLLCRIDDDPQGWDADVLDLLAVDHIPYLILVDKSGTIVERDLRVWELRQYLNK